MIKEHINNLIILHVFKGLSMNVMFILYQNKMQFIKKIIIEIQENSFNIFLKSQLIFKNILSSIFSF